MIEYLCGFEITLFPLFWRFSSSFYREHAAIRAANSGFSGRPVLLKRGSGRNQKEPVWRGKSTL